MLGQRFGLIELPVFLPLMPIGVEHFEQAVQITIEFRVSTFDANRR